MESLPDPEILLERLAEALRSRLEPGFALVGVHTGGAWLAERLHRELRPAAPLGILDISFYRDDFEQIGLHPQVKPSDIPFAVEDHPIVLVDDVLYTGRTVRAAMNELFDYGRPSRIWLAVLVDRGGRELPIAADFVGATISLPPEQHVELKRNGAGELSLALNNG